MPGKQTMGKSNTQSQFWLRYDVCVLLTIAFACILAGSWFAIKMASTHRQRAAVRL
jgi:hypothetical protein